MTPKPDFSTDTKAWTDPEAFLLAEALRRIGYPEEKLEGIQRGIPTITIRRCVPGEVVFHEGDPPESVFIVKAGLVRILKDGPEGMRRVAELGEAEPFGEIGVVFRRPRMATAIAAGPVELYVISGKEFNALLDSSPAFRVRVEQLAHKRTEGF